MSRHEGISCDNCKKINVRGLRYKCLICFNFDLCQECQLSSATPGNHAQEHPMQCILTKNDADIFFGGELEVHQDAFTCPYCSRLGLTEEQLEEHVNRDHSANDLDRDVQCPICAVLGRESGIREDFLGHLTVSHRASPLAGLIGGVQRLRQNAGGGRGHRNESLVDLLTHIGAAGQSRPIPFRSSVHHPSQPHPNQSLQVSAHAPKLPDHRQNSSLKDQPPSLLLTQTKLPSEIDLCQTEQDRSERSLFARHLILSLLSANARWGLLLTGVAYGSFWQSRFTKKELAVKDIKAAEKAARDAKIAEEKARQNAAEMADLERQLK